VSGNVVLLVYSHELSDLAMEPLAVNFNQMCKFHGQIYILQSCLHDINGIPRMADPKFVNSFDMGYVYSINKFGSFFLNLFYLFHIFLETWMPLL